jgi:hypothetical protein
LPSLTITDAPPREAVSDYSQPTARSAVEQDIKRLPDAFLASSAATESDLDVFGGSVDDDCFIGMMTRKMIWVAAQHERRSERSDSVHVKHTQHDGCRHGHEGAAVAWDL